MIKRRGNRAVTVVRWIARVFSGIIAALILVISVGEALTEGYEPILHLTVRETIMMVVFVVVWLGLLLGWKWELTGGLLTVCGMAAFYLVDYLFSGTFPRGPFLFIIAFPGLLFLYCGLKTRQQNPGT